MSVTIERPVADVEKTDEERAWEIEQMLYRPVHALFPKSGPDSCFKRKLLRNRRTRFMSIRSAITLTRSEWLQFKGIGEKCVRLIRKGLAEYELELKK